MNATSVIFNAVIKYLRNREGYSLFRWHLSFQVAQLNDLRTLDERKHVHGAQEMTRMTTFMIG